MVDKYLDIAADEAYVGVKKRDGGPFGAVIVDEKGNIVASGHNMVLKTNDPTNHAEIVAIRKACESLNTYDLSNYIMYSSCEPCPMCLSAIIWSNIKKVYFGATRADAANAGFRDDMIYKYLAGENKILHEKNMKNLNCLNVLEKYKGDVY